MKLFYAPGACSLSPHIVAREAGIDLQLEKVDLRTKKTASGTDYLSINDKGYVPALQLDDGEVLTEGPVIVQYLADLKPASGLAPPASSQERYRLQELLGYINSEIHKTYGPLFNPATPDAVRTQALEALHKRYSWLEKRLAARPYLMGEHFSVADAYLFTVTNWAAHVKLDLSAFPNLQAFQKRVGDRPAVRTALREEGLGK